MKSYLDLVAHVLENGTRKNNRTGTDTIMVFGYHYKVNLKDGFPLITTKKVYFKSVVHELLCYCNTVRYHRTVLLYCYTIQLYCLNLCLN